MTGGGSDTTDDLVTGPAPSGTAHDLVPLLVIEVASLRLGLLASAVVEVHPMVRVTPLPNAPDVVEGVVNVRGRVVPVVGLRARVGASPQPPRLTDHLVVVDVDGRELALHVDRAADLVSVGSEQIDAASAPGLDAAAGVAKLADGLLVVHDLAAFLSGDETRALEDALAASGNE